VNWETAAQGLNPHRRFGLLSNANEITFVKRSVLGLRPSAMLNYQ
jgi:hypothetical protein